jgi:hypothetical protein
MAVKALNYKLDYYTAYHFLEFFLFLGIVFKNEDYAETNRVYRMAMSLLNNFICDIKSITCPPLITAVSCILIAREHLNLKISKRIKTLFLHFNIDISKNSPSHETIYKFYKELLSTSDEKEFKTRTDKKSSTSKEVYNLQAEQSLNSARISSYGSNSILNTKTNVINSSNTIHYNTNSSTNYNTNQKEEIKIRNNSSMKIKLKSKTLDTEPKMTLLSDRQKTIYNNMVVLKVGKVSNKENKRSLFNPLNSLNKNNINPPSNCSTRNNSYRGKNGEKSIEKYKVIKGKLTSSKNMQFINSNDIFNSNDNKINLDLDLKKNTQSSKFKSSNNLGLKPEYVTKYHK